MRLKPLYTVRLHYVDGWGVELKGEGGREEQHFYFAEGTCSGTISGRFRGANHPRRRTDETFTPDFQGVIETDDGALIVFDHQGYGRSYPKGRRQIVGAAWHMSDHEKYRWLNDSICVFTGEVRTPGEQYQLSDVELVVEVSELVWEPPAE